MKRDNTPWGPVILQEVAGDLALGLARNGRIWPVAIWRRGRGYLPAPLESNGVWIGAVYRNLIAAGLIVRWPGDPTSPRAVRSWQIEALRRLVPYVRDDVTRWLRAHKRSA